MSDEIVVNSSILRANDLNLTDYFVMMLLIYHPNINISLDLSNLIERDILRETDVGYLITQNGLDLLERVSTQRNNQYLSNKEIEKLAEEMKLLFPEGKKQGTNKYWRDNKSNVISKLKSFFKKYGYYDYDLILKATNKYVNSFGDNKQLMRTLIYFILKDDSSDLLTVLENIDSDKELINDDSWVTTLM